MVVYSRVERRLSYVNVEEEKKSVTRKYTIDRISHRDSLEILKQTLQIFPKYDGNVFDNDRLKEYEW